MNIYLDLHVLQSVPPNCLNRDDTGSPKTAIYGGVRRARVSSQAWKRDMRRIFKEYFNESELSFRTKYVFDLVTDEIMKAEPEMPREDAMKAALDIFNKVGMTPKEETKKPKKEDESKKKTVEPKEERKKLDTLFFISAQQAKNLAAAALGKADTKEVKKALMEKNGVEIALFGRMVAGNTDLTCEASAQVAHAISTHRVENEYDFFTAVDDLAKGVQEHSGAGMMGTVEFNSSTLYRYATVAAHELFVQLANNSDALEKAIREFVRAFIYSMPTGKQNPFAAHTIPDAVMVTIRTDRPLSLANAFEKPVVGEGFVSASAQAMVTYAKEAYEDFCIQPECCYVVGRHLSELGERLPLDNLLERLGKDVAERVTV